MEGVKLQAFFVIVSLKTDFNASKQAGLEVMRHGQLEGAPWKANRSWEPTTPL